MLPRPINPMRAMAPSLLFTADVPALISMPAKGKSRAVRPPEDRSTSRRQTPGEKYFDGQHGSNGCQPDHRPPGGGQPKTDGGDQIDDGKEHRRGLPRNRMAFERLCITETNPAYLRPVIEALDHR